MKVGSLPLIQPYVPKPQPPSPRELWQMEARRHADEAGYAAFSEEREALAIELLWTEGQQTAARDRLARFLVRYPASAYAQRFAAWSPGHDTGESR